MNRNIQIFFTALALALPLAGCIGDEHAPEPAVADQEIRFGVSGDAATRGFDTTLDDLPQVGIYGYYTATERWEWLAANRPSALKPNYFTNEQLLKSGAPGAYSWSYEGLPRFWPPDTRNKVSFFAYAPYEATIDTNGDPVDLEAQGKAIVPYPAVPTDKGVPVVRYTVPSTVKEHIDLLWGARRDMTRLGIDEDPVAVADDNIVPVQMGHALTKITFSAQYADPDDADDYIVKVQSISIAGIHNTGVLRLDTGEWSFDDAAAKPGYTVVKAELDPTVIADGNLVYKLLNNTGPADGHVGSLMMIPQPLDNANLVVNLVFTELQSGMDTETPVSFSLRDTAPKWQSGLAIDYRILIKGGFITVHTSMENWHTGNPGSGNVTP